MYTQHTRYEEVEDNIIDLQTLLLIFANKFRKILITQFESNTLFELQKFNAFNPLEVCGIPSNTLFCPSIVTVTSCDFRAVGLGLD